VFILLIAVNILLTILIITAPYQVIIALNIVYRSTVSMWWLWHEQEKEEGEELDYENLK